MEILLTYKAGDRGARDPFTSLLPVGLGSINALVLKYGHHSRVANLSRYNWRQIKPLLVAESPRRSGDFSIHP